MPKRIDPVLRERAGLLVPEYSEEYQSNQQAIKVVARQEGVAILRAATTFCGGTRLPQPLITGFVDQMTA